MNQNQIDKDGEETNTTSSDDQIQNEEITNETSPLPPSLFPSPPDITFNWVDIGDEFNECCKDLALGELLHDDSFGLFEAMSAIEMMDPKMDAGLLCNRGDRKVLNFDQSVEAGVLKLNKFKDAELIGIIDATFSCFVSWLEGHSLAQTVFTNLYMHKPFEIKNRNLKIFCITMHRILELVGNFIQSAGVFEEEDFQTPMCRYCIPNISEQRVIGMLKEAEDELYRRTKLKFQTTVKSQYYANPDPALAVYARLKAVRLFFTLLTVLGQMRKQKSEESVPECIKTVGYINELITVIQNSIEFGSKHTSLGFEPLVNQRLLPPTFPRYTKIKPSDQAYKYLEEFLERVRYIVKVQNQTAFHSAVDFFIEFSRTRPCVLSRSILQTLYFGNSSVAHCGSPNTIVLTNILFVDVLRDACKNFIAPPSLTTKQTTFSNVHVERAFLQGRECVNSFFLHCIRPFTNMIKLYGHNHARQRDKLAHLLEDLAALQDEAERVDAFLHNQYLTLKIGRPHLACFVTWVLYHTLQVMIMYLLAGFELELYSTHEYYYIYWYMYEFLYGWLISALNRAENFMSYSSSDNDTSKTRANKKVKTKKKKNANTKPYEREVLYYQALQNMCGGYYKGLFGLRYDGFMKLPCNEFSRESIRFEHRFAPFRALVTPPPVSYKEFLDSTHVLCANANGEAQNKNIYRFAAEHFLQARIALENIGSLDKEVSGLLKVVKWNFVVFKILAGGHKTDIKTLPDFDFTEHRLFPLIKIQMS
ncbi:N-alpha-acetyltransferase 35, NatC auxiliary subunit [Chrysoperla carnea]|uniref:N-alpha-acetyltransferase 35, NatC auxiliary subunit n=1 Tax=Chrysoperla carnea TaxID=189513 RepID=UPI001D094FA1|nr:N-alpha-acetyltransferase 35, NatC auxiliary subunit [Chrysoperla carnea]